VRTILKAFALLVVIGAVLIVVIFILIGSRGISAKVRPGKVETIVARTMRRLAIPRGDRSRRNPVAPAPAIVAEGMAHYADHCAACHANDGSGETEMGLGLYPKPPDMRLQATQSLSDGELFYIIENGVRLTGMPAWSTGKPEGETATWHLVHFIRELPRLTPEQIQQMQGLNPRSPAEVRQQIEEEKFLQGGDAPPPPPPTQTHTGAHE
jgi:mono/diheme cytochrome c family protein